MKTNGDPGKRHRFPSGFDENSKGRFDPDGFGISAMSFRAGAFDSTCVTNK